MKVGDLVRHKGFGTTYLVVETPAQAKAGGGGMVAILSNGEKRWVARNWLEVISEGG